MYFLNRALGGKFLLFWKSTFIPPPYTFLSALTFISLKPPVFEPLFEARLEIKGKRCQRSRTYYERFAWEQYKSAHGFRMGKISVPKERDDSNPTYFEHFSVLTVWPMLINYFQKMHVRRNILASGAVCLYFSFKIRYFTKFPRWTDIGVIRLGKY